jgi:hypothetical protein
MADDGHNAEWDEVGRLFGELGRRLQAKWSENRPERPAGAEEAEDGGLHVGAVFNELKTSISRTVSDPEVRETAGRASTTLADAVATNLRQLADWIERKPGSGGTAGGETVADEVTPSDPPAEG